MLKRRLKSFFGSRTGERRLEDAAVRDALQTSPGSPDTEATGTTTEAESRTPEGTSPEPQTLGKADRQRGPGSLFTCPDLFTEVQTNAAIARAPQTGTLSAFETAAWDGRLSAPGSLQKDTEDQLNEAYIDIELANRLVWLSEVAGRVTKEMAESYTRLCTSIAERLDTAISQATAGTEEAALVRKTITRNVDRKSVEIEEKTDVAERSANTEADEGNEILFLGIARLIIAQGANGSQIARLADSLSKAQDIRVISSGGSSRGRSQVTLSVDRPQPLLKVLRSIPVVSLASKRGNDIEIVLGERQ